MTREEHAAIFAAHVMSRLVPALVERCGVLLDGDTQAVVHDVVADSFLRLLAPPDDAARAVREGHAAGWRTDPRG